jgi:hypothetical protein
MPGNDRQQGRPGKNPSPAVSTSIRLDRQIPHVRADYYQARRQLCKALRQMCKALGQTFNARTRIGKESRKISKVLEQNLSLAGNICQPAGRM